MDRQHSQPVPNARNSLQSGVRKRRRKALSCYECRRRKVKCDRGAPACNRCRETGQAGSCSYTLEAPTHVVDEDASESADEVVTDQRGRRNVPGPTSDLSTQLLSILKQQARRIAQLENELAGLDVPPSREWKGFEQFVAGPRISMAENSISKMEIYVQDHEPREPEAVLIRGGKGFETKFYGASNATSLIGHFPELRDLFQESLRNNSSLVSIQRDMHAKAGLQKGNKGQLIVSDNYLFEILPRKEILDPLMLLYFENFETTFRVLHQPSFWEEYNKFWHDPEAGSPGFVVILLLVASMVSCISSREQSESTGAFSPREIWVSWIEACDVWLSLQSQKHLNLANFQIRCLLVLSKQMIMVKEKQAWTSATSLLSFSISAGLHRDPSLLKGRISMFDQEMRRRLWGTIVELEIDASIDRGVRPFSTDLHFDCPPPSNLDDKVFSMTSEHLPKEDSSIKFTRASFLCNLHRSRSYRTALISIINNPKSNLQYEELLCHEGKLLKMIKDLPQWDSLEDMSPQYSIVPRMLLEIQLRQLLLLLHSPWARQTDCNPRYNYSRMMCIDTSKHILDQYSNLTKSGSYALLILRNDVVRAALSFCHNWSISRTLRSYLSSLITGCSVSPLLNNAILMLEEKVTRLERGYKNYLFVSIAYGIILSQEFPEQSEHHRFEAIERATNLYTKILTSTGENFQPNMREVEAAQPSAVGSKFLTAANPTNLMTNPSETMTAADDLPLDLFDFGDFSDWPLDDLWPQDFTSSNMSWL